MHAGQKHLARGFTFTEVMFAVVLLGIGFIMLAAMFPVAIQQTKTTSEETVGSQVARGAMEYLGRIATDTTMPTTGNSPGAVGVGSAFWNAIKGNLILADDQRYAWTALYRRELTASGEKSPYAQVFVFPVEIRNRPLYIAADTERPPAGIPASLEPKPIFLKLARGNSATVNPFDQIQFYNNATATATPMAVDAAAPGAYVIVANDAQTGFANGRIYKLGQAIDAANGLWQLAPGSDLSLDSDALGTYPTIAAPVAFGYMIGRGYADPTYPVNAIDAPIYEGVAQDIVAFTGYVKVKP